MSEAAAENPPMEGENMDEESPMMDNKSGDDGSEKDDDNKSTEESTDDPTPKKIMSPCCCCLCACSNEFTEELSCCGCFPIKCGIVTIGIFTFILTLVLVI